MKKILYLAVVFCCILALPVVAAMQSNSGNDANKSNKNDSMRPVYATNIKIAKKIPVSSIIRETKGKPSFPSRQDKDKNKEVATGALGSSVMGNKYAIIIGICDYPEDADGIQEINDICVSDGDSLHMYKALIELYGYIPENIRLFKDGGGETGFINAETEKYIIAGVPTYDNIKQAVAEIEGLANENDEVVFFFSGHGTSGEADDGDNEIIDEGIIVHDNNGSMDLDGYKTLDFIWDGELKSWFSGFATSRIVFIFDTCRAGGMNDVASDGRIVVMATAEDKSAYVYSTVGEDVDGDGQQDGEGVFSRLFVHEGMLDGLADEYDHDNDDSTQDVVIEEAFDYAQKNIPSYLKRKQKPVISDRFVDDLLL